MALDSADTAAARTRCDRPRGGPRGDLDDDLARRLRRGPRCHATRRRRGRTLVASGARVPPTHTVLARERPTARSRSIGSGRGALDPGGRRDDRADGSSRHLRRTPPDGSRLARRGRAARLRSLTRRGGRLRPRVLGDRRRPSIAGSEGTSPGGRRPPRSSSSPLRRGTGVRSSGAALARVEKRLEGFRAAPLSNEETLRRAGPARSLRAPRLDRIRPRRQQRAGDQGLRDPGGDHVPRRRRGRVRRSRAGAARARPGRHPSRQGRACRASERPS